MLNSQNTTEGQATDQNLPDVSKFTIEQSLDYQKTNNLNLESFITNFANKIKFNVSSFLAHRFL